MAAKSDHGFPCFLLSEGFSEQSHELQQRPGSDYVFFSPAMVLKESNARSLNLESLCGALPKAGTGLSEDACGIF